MEDREEQKIFRQETMDRISSPEQLTDYLRVTNPGIWMILIAVIILLAGLFAWSFVGILETKTDATVVVKNQEAQVILAEAATIKKGMPLRINEDEYVISSVEKDEYGREIAHASVTLPDGTYEGVVVTERTRPISFLLESR